MLNEAIPIFAGCCSYACVYACNSLKCDLNNQPVKPGVGNKDVAAAAQYEDFQTFFCGEFECVNNVVLARCRREITRRAANLQGCQRRKRYVLANFEGHKNREAFIIRTPVRINQM